MTKQKLRRPPPGYMAEHIFAAMKLTVYLFQCWPLFCRSCPFAPQPVLPTSSETWAGEVNGNWVFSTHVDASKKKGFRPNGLRSRAVQQRNCPKGPGSAGGCLGIVVHGSKLCVLCGQLLPLRVGFRLYRWFLWCGMSQVAANTSFEQIGKIPKCIYPKTILRTFHF